MPYAKILAGVDGSETSMNALRHAARLAAAQRAELLIVCVHRSSPEDPAVQKTLDSAKSLATEEGVDAGVRGEPGGKPAEALLRLAEQEGVDLIVVGNKGMAGTKRFLLGSVPNQVSHHAPCDVLIIKTT